MLKALLKKQLLEFFAGFTIKGKDGKSKGIGAKAGAAVLMAFMGITFFGMFLSFSYMMVPVIESGNSALYLSVFGIISVLMGLMGSVFLTYHTIYEAKDNDMLLSMPILPSVIIFARMAGLYITTLGFQLLVLLPSAVVFFITAGFGVIPFILYLSSVLILPLLSLSVALVLGFFIALFASKVRNKSMITVVFSLAFLGVYYFSMMKINDVINILVYRSEEVALFIKKWLYPFYVLGKGINGDALSFMLFTVICVAAFGVIYLVISRTFFKLAIVNKGGKKVKYKEKKAKQTSARLAFFKKELLYFRNTPAYILNSSFGSVMLILVSVIFAVKKEMILPVLTQTGFPDVSFPLIAGIALCTVASSNNITAVSVSLEGKNIYLLHSLPCNIADVFFGKIMLHTAVTGIPLVVGNIIVSVSLGADIATAVLMIIFSLLFTLVVAQTGLIINILFPKLEWVNETVPIKQSLSSVLGIFSGFAYGLMVFLGCIATISIIPPRLFLIGAALVYAAILFALTRWLRLKGCKKFVEL